MPIKQVSCCKCGNLVNKAQTYSIGKDQRACKSHEGVVERRAELEVAKVQKRKAEASKFRAREERKTGGGWAGNPMIPRCWVCMNEGLRAPEFFERVLIEREKFTQQNPNASIMDILNAPAKAKIGRCIFVLMREKCEAAMKFVREDFAQLVSLGGCLAICGPCCGTFKIEPLKQPTPEQLRDAMVVALVVEPVIKEIAAAEIAAAAAAPAEMVKVS